MTVASDSLVGKSIEWRGVRHSLAGDCEGISTHIVSYETLSACYVTAGGVLVGEASYQYRKLDDRMAVLICRPELYQGRSGVVLYAMLNFDEWTDRAVILADGEPFAVAKGSMREVVTPPRPS